MVACGVSAGCFRVGAAARLIYMGKIERESAVDYVVCVALKVLADCVCEDG